MKNVVCTLVALPTLFAMNDVSIADIYQYKDCDWNGTLLLTELYAEPDAELSGLYLGCADLASAHMPHANLSDTDLTRAILIDTELSYTDLTGANLSEADLTQAYLVYADLTGANLSHADLANADLRYANLSGANLSNADLSGALLYSAALYGADLSHAYLYYANLSNANLSGADLGNVNGWESATWTNATYNDETVFPSGMNPEKYGMINMSYGACCVVSGCIELEETDCNDLGGTLMVNAGCDDCAPAEPTGGCCVSSGCDTLEESSCTSLGGTWLGEGGSCDDCAPTCSGDLNADGVVGVDDLLAMLAAWGACP